MGYFGQQNRWQTYSLLLYAPENRLIQNNNSSGRRLIAASMSQPIPARGAAWDVTCGLKRSLQPVHDTEGDLYKVVKFASVVSEQVEREAEVRESRRQCFTRLSLANRYQCERGASVGAGHWFQHHGTPWLARSSRLLRVKIEALAKPILVDQFTICKPQLVSAAQNNLWHLTQLSRRARRQASKAEVFAVWPMRLRQLAGRDHKATERNHFTW